MNAEHTETIELLSANMVSHVHLDVRNAVERQAAIECGLVELYPHVFWFKTLTDLACFFNTIEVIQSDGKDTLALGIPVHRTPSIKTVVR